MQLNFISGVLVVTFAVCINFCTCHYSVHPEWKEVKEPSEFACIYSAICRLILADIDKSMLVQDNTAELNQAAYEFDQFDLFRENQDVKINQGCNQRMEMCFDDTRKRTKPLGDMYDWRNSEIESALENCHPKAWHFNFLGCSTANWPEKLVERIPDDFELECPENCKEGAIEEKNII